MLVPLLSVGSCRRIGRGLQESLTLTDLGLRQPFRSTPGLPVAASPAESRAYLGAFAPKENGGRKRQWM
jgi:hypothetical protein